MLIEPDRQARLLLRAHVVTLIYGILLQMMWGRYCLWPDPQGTTSASTVVHIRPSGPGVALNAASSTPWKKESNSPT